MDDPGAASSSRSAREEDDDDEEYDEPGGGSRLLGFMFGNVDCSGDLDADYLDEDAKEHLAALADKLGASLTDIDLTKSPSTSTGISEQDYDEKAEDAVDYEGIEEQYEGPEIEVTDGSLFQKKEYFGMDVSLASLNHKSSIFDEENYDEDEEIVNEVEGVNASSDVPLILKEGQEPEVVTETGEPPHDDASSDALSDIEHMPSAECLQDGPVILEGHVDCDKTTPLPVLCIEDGMVILRFSEIFGVHEPLRKKEKKTHPRVFTSNDHAQSSYIIEEDEETFLKTYQGDPTLSRQLILRRDDTVHDSEIGAEKSTLSMDQKTSKLFSGGQPMKDGQVLDMDACWSAHIIPNFYPLEQQDWEERIIWGNSPPQNDRNKNIFIASESDTDNFHARREENEHDCLANNLDAELNAASKHSVSTQSAEGLYHSQMLRPKSQVRGGSGEPDESKMGDGNEAWGGNFIQRFNKMSLQNKDLVEGSWLDHIIWDPDKPFPEPKLIIDLQDEHMLFEILEHKDDGILHANDTHFNSSQKLPTGDAHDHSVPIVASAGRFNISNDKYYASRKSSQQLKAHAKKRSICGLKIMHSVPALRLQTMKPRLSNKEISNFHRPKALWYPPENKEATALQGEFRCQGSFKIILKTLAGKIFLLRVGAQEQMSSVIAKSSKKLDFRSTEKVKIIYNGKELEENDSMASQNVRPNSMIHILRTKIHIWPRAQRLPGDNKPLRPPGAFKKKSELSVKDGHVVLVEYCEERPLLLSNAGMGARLCTYYQKLSPADQTASSLRNGNTGLGNVLPLDPADKSPFLGEIAPGCTQSSIETNMYRAPIFLHETPSTDYLLVRSAKGMLSLRRVDKIFSAGQQEPHMEVMTPATKNVQNYIWNRLLVYIYREFRAKEKPGFLPSIRVDELSSRFPSVAESFLRKKLKHCADLQRGSKGQFFWEMRPSFRIPSEDELRRMVTPENVCSYESMQAGLHLLKSLGITSLTLPVGLSAAMNRLPDEAIALAAASHIERELQITSWNLSSNFVACTNLDRENIERLEITGVGDPSGRGLGFSYVRATPKTTGTSTSAKKKAPAPRGGTTVTGTDADLRRLSMDAAREVLLKFNIPEENIGKMTRWHRIAMIRKLSSEQAASGINLDTETLSKFARGQRMSFVQLQQQTREKCQEIWDRQVQSLSAADGDENDSDSEANSDLDSFAGDLENLLDAEEYEEGDEGNVESKVDRIDGVRGLKMRRCPSQAQTKEEIEDEETEVAEIRRLIDADESAAKLKRKMISSEKQQKIGPVTAEGKNLLAQTTSVPKLDVSYASKDAMEQDIYEVDESVVETLSGKAKARLANGNTDELLSMISKKQMKSLKDGGKIVKEKKPFDKPVRENFVCGACGQLGHMRTNKNCPKYRDSETQDSENVSGKYHLPDSASGQQMKTPNKKLVHKGISVIKTPTSAAPGNSEKSGQKLKARVSSLKVKCGPPDKPRDNIDGVQVSLKQISGVTPDDLDNEARSSGKISKIIISNKSKPETAQPDVTKPSVVIRTPGEMDRDQPQKKIIIRKPRSVTHVGSIRRGGAFGKDEEVRKTKKITELAGFEDQRAQHVQWVAGDMLKEATESSRLREEDEKRQSRQRISEERTRRILEERRMADEQQRLYEIRMARELKEQAKAKKKKKKKKKIDFRDEYMEEYTSNRRDRRIPERDRAAKRRPEVDLGRHAADYGPPTKRRRGGEVLLSNVLESIVDKLRDNTAVSYLFLKPVTKKEAPDYLDYIKQPMDLATIKEKARRMEYKNREEFRHDVWQIAYNAHVYNDRRNPNIPPLADQLLELCDYLLDTNDESLAEAESGIERPHF